MIIAFLAVWMKSLESTKRANLHCWDNRQTLSEKECWCHKGFTPGKITSEGFPLIWISANTDKDILTDADTLRRYVCAWDLHSSLIDHKWWSSFRSENVGKSGCGVEPSAGTLSEEETVATCKSWGAWSFAGWTSPSPYYSDDDVHHW